MPAPSLAPLLDKRFRANPAFELLALDQLTPADRRALGALASDPDAYGILRPRDARSLTIKAVGHETAALLFALRAPSRLPDVVRGSVDTGANGAIARLV